MTKSNFSEGTMVELMSGGPSMTIREIANDEAVCEWFDKNLLRTHSFKLSSLREPPPSPYYDGIGFGKPPEGDNEQD